VHASGGSVTVKCIPSGEIRRINRYSIIKFNNEDVVI
jgi:hypothetical protein